MEVPHASEEKWWKKAHFYQIWPRSFCDSNNDGIGDLKGITSKLGYLSDLGIDAIWITPFFASPNKDNGYDISNYREIDPSMGTMQDFEELISEAHKRNIKVIIDMVFNHCSSEHEWFKKSCQNDPKYKDYFIWRDGKGAKKNGYPNNWGSIFGTPAWTYVEERKQFYFTMFSPHQPDLNWENPKVIEEIKEIIRFWNAKGIDGYRLDALSHVSKPPGLPSYKSNEKFVTGNLHQNGPRMHEFIKVICSTIREKKDMVIFGELSGVPNEQIDITTNPANGQLDMAILFDHVWVDTIFDPIKGKFNNIGFSVQRFRNCFEDWYSKIKNGWICLYLCNHDLPRVVSRWGNDKKYWIESAKMFAMLNTFLKGSPFIFQGEEIGMTNWKFKKEEANDLEFFGYFKSLVEERKIYTEEQFMEICHKVGRDTARSPVQWSDEANAGFTKGKPWLPVNTEFTKINASSQKDDPNSVFNFYKKIINLRKSNPIFINGKLKQFTKIDDDILGHERFLSKEKDAETFYLLFNISDQEKHLKKLALDPHYEYQVILSNYPASEFDGKHIRLNPWQGLLIKRVKKAE